MPIEFDAEDGDIIQTIKDSVKTETIKVADDEFLTRPVHLAPSKPLAKALKIASLTGLVDYIEKEIDAAANTGRFVQVESPTTVNVLNEIDGREDRRFGPIYAEADTPRIVFDSYLPKEEAMIMLQSRFFPTLERDALLEKLGNLVADEELRQEDDGVSQTITTQTGLRRSESTIVNPVSLCPFRTFVEIEQPESPFIVRLRSTGKGIEVALFEADGGAWRNAARLSIKEYLEMELVKNQIPVIA